MANISQWVGIDVSKATLDVYIRPIGKALKVANTEGEISQLVEMQTAEKNRRARARGKALADIEAHIEYLAQRLEQLNQEIEQMTQNNQQWMNKVNLLKTTPGIGQVISTTLVSDLPELGQLTAKQIARLVGVAPINHDSGQHKGKRMINGGRAQIRATLYMGAVVAIRHNPMIKAFYTRLVERGKSKKLALTACVRKMLVILNAMVRDNQTWHVPDDNPRICPSS